MAFATDFDTKEREFYDKFVVFGLYLKYPLDKWFEISAQYLDHSTQVKFATKMIITCNPIQ